MSNKLTNINMSQNFYKYISGKARAEGRSVSSYIRNAVKQYSGYTSDTLATKATVSISDDDDLLFDE